MSATEPSLDEENTSDEVLINELHELNAQDFNCQQCLASGLQIEYKGSYSCMGCGTVSTGGLVYVRIIIYKV